MDNLLKDYKLVADIEITYDAINNAVRRIQGEKKKPAANDLYDGNG